MKDPIFIKLKQNVEVEKKIQRTAKSLTKKRNKKRKVNEKSLLNQKTGFKKVASTICDVIFAIVLIICCILCTATVVSRANRVPANFFGYNYIHIVSGSMKASGFNVGDKIAVRAVYTESLKPGDMIAFYVYPQSYKTYNTSSKKVTQFSTETDYSFNIGRMFGAYNKDIKQASKANASILFHQIVEIREDSNGVRWFKTKGTSNAYNDPWYINENLVLGAYDDSVASSVMSNMLTFLSSKAGFILIIYLPQILLFYLAFKWAIKNVQLTFLELDVLEGKRKITDKICVQNDIGFNMGAKEKLKVLASAKDNEKLEYMNLLWHEGTASVGIQKYLVRKSLILRKMTGISKLNKECERRIARGDSPSLVAKFYQFEKQKIEEETARYQRLLRDVHNKYKK